MDNITPEEALNRLAVLRERNNRHSKASYHRHAIETRKRQLLRRLASGQRVKLNTLKEYGIDYTTIPRDQIKDVFGELK